MAVLQVFLLTLFVLSTRSSDMFSNMLTLDGGNYNVSWNFNATSDTLEFLVEVRTQGWVGFGVAEPPATGMINYDVAIGGVLSNGTSYFGDYYTIGFSAPPLDVQQNWILLNSSEENDVTTLKFYRKRNTTDQENDTAIPIGMPIYIVWAYHSSTDSLAKHTARGRQQEVLVPADTSTMTQIMMTTTATMATATPTPAPTLVATTPSIAINTQVIAPTTAEPTLTATPSIAINTQVIAPTTATVTAMPMPPPMHFANFLSLNDGKYNVSWMHNASMDTLHFMVEVMATGWIGFGFSTVQPPTTPRMTGYDVAVATVNAAGGNIMDYLTVGTRLPDLDQNQDWTLTYSNEYNGVTTLRFYRNLNTTDQRDVVIQPGVSVYLIWAYHLTSDTIIYHGLPYRGFERVTFVPTTETMQFTHFYDMDRFLLRWTFHDQNDTIMFHIRVKTTGWVGFGFADNAPSAMRDYDVIVGGFDNGQGYLNDYYTVGQIQPLPDPSNDYQLVYASEIGGYTELMFQRQRDTNDNNDLQFEVGEEKYIIWAYGNGDIRNPSAFDRHVLRGVGDKVVIVDEQPVPTQAAVSSLHSRINAILIAVAIIFLNVLVM